MLPFAVPLLGTIDSTLDFYFATIERV